MAPKTHSAFFSYSRQDSEFVLKLAKDLKTARAVIWLDQLDIKPGQHWDTTLEEALQTCPNMLLVLSPDSVASQNVMDEVSFAIEEHKLIIPILYRTCKVPLRLRRLQYIDARVDYDTAFNELRRLLAPDDEAQAERETRLQVQRASIGAGQERSGQENDRVRREQADQAAEAQTANYQQARGRAAEAAAAADFPGLSSPLTVQPRKQTGKRLLAGAAVILALIIGSIWRAATTGSSERSNLMQERSLANVDTSPGAKSSDTKFNQPNKSIQVSSEPAGQPVPSTSEWAKRFVSALASSSITTLQPFFDETVSPYYSIPRADWAAIEKDKQSFFSAFPVIRYTIVGEPTEISQSDGRAKVELDMQYQVVRRDGQRREGMSHLSMDLHLVEGEWRLAGIRERVSGK